MSERLEPGKVSGQQFDLLLAGTSIRGERVIAALRDHLVGGLSQTEAWEKHGVNKSQFSRRLDVIKKESLRAEQLAPFYSSSQDESSMFGLLKQVYPHVCWRRDAQNLDDPYERREAERLQVQIDQIEEALGLI